MTCVCSLAGTAACKTCWHNPDSTGQFNNFVTWTTTSNYDIQRNNEMKVERADDYKQAAEYWQRMYEESFTERTCINTAPVYLDFLCSECGFVHYHSDENDMDGGNEWNYCPNCGAKVVNE